MIKKLKEAFECKTNRELAEKLGVHEANISRWNSGRVKFPIYVEKGFNLLLDKINQNKT